MAALRRRVMIGLPSIACLVLGGALPPNVACAAAEAADPGEQASAAALSTQEHAKLVEQKLDLLDRLLEGPSGRRVAASESPEAEALLALAQQVSNDARRTLAAGQTRQAEGLVDEALKSLTIANRLVARPRDDDAILSARYTQLRAGLISFQDALERAIDADPAAAKAIDIDKVDTLRVRAETLALEGDYRDAVTLLAEAHAMTVGALSKVRQNETVVYSRELESPAEAYEYERERNRSHRALVDHLIAQGALSRPARELADHYVVKGSALRDEAEALARAESWQEATDAMERATAELVRIQRIAGLPAFE